MRAEELRKSILQQAIQGKLVKQNPADEPASVLLERIRAEKERLVAEGKLKKDKNSSHIYKGDDGRYYEKIGKATPVDITDDFPFEIPENWTWARIKTIANLYTGNSISDIDKKKKYAIKVGYNFVATKDVGFDHIIRYDESIHIPFDTDFRIAPANKILLCIEGGSAGRKIAITKDTVCFGNKLACFDTYWPIDKFFYYYIQSPELQKIFKDSISGIIGGVSINKLKEFFLPIPPLAEQERIVKRIEELMPLLDEYTRLEAKDKALDDNLPTLLKQAILQHAIQGKLVEQDVNDEPASLLLERIRNEKKAQLGKKYVESYIYKGGDCYYEKVGSTVKNISDEIPFDIPDSWCWARMSSVINIVSARRVHQSDWRSEGIPFYRAREIAKLATLGTIQNELFISQELFDSYKASGIPIEGDLMVTAVGTLGKTYIVKPEDKFYYKDASVLCFENRYGISALWLKYLMDSPHMVKQIKDGSVGTTVGTITIEKANCYFVPIPPLAEQKRIVEKLNEIFAKL